MGRACFDEFFNEIDNLELTELTLSEISVMGELDKERREFTQHRKTIENYQERKRLRNDLEFFS